MRGIGTHILDIARGKPVQGMKVKFEYQDDEEFKSMAEGITDADGRVRDRNSRGRFKPTPTIPTTTSLDYFT